MNETARHPTDEELAALLLEGDHSGTAEHVGSCADCSQRLQRFAAVRDSVAALPEEEVPEDVRRHLLALHGKKRRAVPGFILSVMGSPFWFPILGGVAALALILFLFFVYLSMQ
jgi:anti-sigma factor RsiW